MSDMIRVNNRRIPLEDRDDLLDNDRRLDVPSPRQREFEEAFARFQAEGRNPKVVSVGEGRFEMVVDPVVSAQTVVRVQRPNSDPTVTRDGIPVLFSDSKQFNPDGFARVRRSRVPSGDEANHRSWHGEND